MHLLCKCAAGLCDDVVSLLVAASACPILMAPSMNDRMWANAATVEAVEKLKNRGVVFVGPDSGVAGRAATKERGGWRIPPTCSMPSRPPWRDGVFSRKRLYPELAHLTRKQRNALIRRTIEKGEKVDAFGCLSVIVNVGLALATGMAYNLVARRLGLDGLTYAIGFFIVIFPAMFLLGGIGDAIHSISLRPRIREKLLHLCPACGYDLTGNASGVCPECGRERDATDPSQPSSR